MGKITVNASRNVVSTHWVNVCTALISIKYVLQFYYHSSVLGTSFWKPKNKNKSLRMTWEDDSLGARDETGVSWSNWGPLPTFPRPCSAREFLITGHIFPGYVDLAGQLGQRGPVARFGSVSSKKRYPWEKLHGTFLLCVTPILLRQSPFLLPKAGCSNPQHDLRTGSYYFFLSHSFFLSFIDFLWHPRVPGFSLTASFSIFLHWRGLDQKEGGAATPPPTFLRPPGPVNLCQGKALGCIPCKKFFTQWWGQF